MSNIKYDLSSPAPEYPLSSRLPCSYRCTGVCTADLLGNYDKAVEAIIAPNPMASVCGIICAPLRDAMPAQGCG